MDGRQPTATTGIRRLRRFAPTVVLLCLLVVAGWWILESGRSATFIEALRDAEWRFIAAATGVYVVSWPLRGDRFRRILVPMGWHCRTGYLTVLVFLSQAANLVVPARAGDGARAYLLSDQRDVPLSTGIAALTVERIVDLLAIVALAIGAVGIQWALDPDAVPTLPVGFDAATIVAGGVFAAGVGAIFIVYRRSNPTGLLDSRHPWLQRLLDGCRTARDSFERVLADSRAMLAIIGGSILIWAIDVATAVLVLASLVGGGSVPAIILIGTIAVGAGNVAKVIPLTQGGVGLYEAAFAAVIVASTPIGLEVALLAAILDHGLKNLVTGVGGLWGYVVLRRERYQVEVESPIF